MGAGAWQEQSLAVVFFMGGGEKGKDWEKAQKQYLGRKTWKLIFSSCVWLLRATESDIVLKIPPLHMKMQLSLLMPATWSPYRDVDFLQAL